MIPDRWYPILEATKLRKRPRGIQRLGRKIVLWRDQDGRPVALPGACPHRGASLAQGKLVNAELACPWHGFRFAASGDCTSMPCEGNETTPPRAMRLSPYPILERHGLIWLFHSSGQDAPEEIPFFDELAGADLRGTAQASYVLPYHYSRLVETNLDLHHTPFVHASVFPNQPRVDPFEAYVDGDRIRTRGTLRRENEDSGFDFRADCLLPGLGLIGLGKKLWIVTAATPVDDHTSWMWFRYYQDYTSLRWVAKAITWIAVQSELRVVQRQDWRIFAGLTPGTIDDVPYHFVRADQGIALYRKRRRELLEAAAKPMREAV